MDRRPRWSAPGDIAIIGGVALMALTLLVHLRLVSLGFGLGSRPGIQLWLFGGAFVLGALPAYASARYGLASPALVSGLLYALSLLGSWSVLVTGTGSAALSPTLFEIALWYWPILLWLSLAAGALEYGIRFVTARRVRFRVENRT